MASNLRKVGPLAPLAHFFPDASLGPPAIGPVFGWEREGSPTEIDHRNLKIGYQLVLRSST